MSGHASHWENYIQDCPEEDLDECLYCFSVFIFKIPVTSLQQYLGSYLFALLSERIFNNRPSAEHALKALFRINSVYLWSNKWFKQLLHDKDEQQVARAINALAILIEFYGPSKLEKQSNVIREFEELGESQQYLDATMRFYNAASVYE